jgi:hypothetical protein
VNWIEWLQCMFIWWDFVNTGRELPVTYEGVSKSFRTGRLERELQMV